MVLRHLLEKIEMNEDEDLFNVGLTMIRDFFAVIGIVAALCMTLGYFWGLVP